MTAIAGFCDAGVVWIGGDSAGVSGLDLTIRKDSKVFLNGEFIFGCTTSFRMAQLLRYRLSVPAKRADEDVFAYMVTTFVESVRECLKAGGFAEKEKESERGGSFLVGYQGRLFLMDGDYHVGEPFDGYDACGCGAQAAKGALFATSGRGFDPEVRMLIALEAAERHSAGVRAPFNLLALGEKQL